MPKIIACQTEKNPKLRVFAKQKRKTEIDTELRPRHTAATSLGPPRPRSTALWNGSRSGAGGGRPVGGVALRVGQRPADCVFAALPASRLLSAAKAAGSRRGGGGSCWPEYRPGLIAVGLASLHSGVRGGGQGGRRRSLLGVRRRPLVRRTARGRYASRRRRSQAAAARAGVPAAATPPHRKSPQSAHEGREGGVEPRSNRGRTAVERRSEGGRRAVGGQSEGGTRAVVGQSNQGR